MKKIVLALASTVSMLVLLFGYHTSTSGPTTTTASPPAVVSSHTGSTTTSGKQSASKASTLTGDVAQTEWGPVQVEVTMSGGSITDVAVLQYPSGNGRDQEINSYALPILINETMDAQNANIDMVSGATVTSTGYLQSLQSALDQAATA